MLERCYKTFVSLGNTKQHFTRLLNAVKSQFDFFPQPILIQHGHTPFESHSCEAIDFITMDNFARLTAEAELLIFHAGAGSVLHAINAGKYPIIMPRLAKFDEHINNHQLEFAKALQSLEKIILVETPDELAQAIKKNGYNSKTLNLHNNKSPIFNVIKKLIDSLML